jgi:hypothetical protein
LLAHEDLCWDACILTPVGEALALLELGWHGSSCRDGDDGSDDGSELHGKVGGDIGLWRGLVEGEMTQ